MTWRLENVLDRLSAFDGEAERRSNEEAEVKGDLDPKDRNPFVRGDKPLRPAAVLVPLVNRPQGATVLLTKRTDHLKNHAGQISFPGGRVDDTDRDAIHTALRETEEEIGLAETHINVVGHLDEYVVGTGFLVNPVIGVIEPPFDLNLHEQEVAEAFEVPLSYALDPQNIERHARDFNGTKRHFFAITWNDYYIWGATAGMLRNLSQRVWISTDT